MLRSFSLGLPVGLGGPAIYDVVQTEHSIVRGYPVPKHLRSLASYVELSG